MEKEAKKFQHTSLEEVTKADIQLVKRLILKEAGIEDTLISKTITFGELICNRYYDYITIYGKWLSFGVKLQFHTTCCRPLPLSGVPPMTANAQLRTAWRPCQL